MKGCPIDIYWPLFMREKVNSMNCATFVLCSWRDSSVPFCILSELLKLTCCRRGTNHTSKCSHWEDFLFNLISAGSPTESRSLNISRFRGQGACFLDTHSMWKTACYLSPGMQVPLWVNQSTHTPQERREMPMTASYYRSGSVHLIGSTTLSSSSKIQML